MNRSASAVRGPERRFPYGRALSPLARGGLVLAAAAPLLAVGPAAVAGYVAPSASSLAFGRADVMPCGSISSAVVSYAVTAGTVTSVTVAGLPAACNGSTLWLALTSSGTALALAGPAVVSAGGAVVATPAAPQANSVTDARIVLSG